MTEALAALGGVVVGAILGYFGEFVHWRRSNAQTARLALHRVPGLIWADHHDYYEMEQGVRLARVHLTSIGIDWARIDVLAEATTRSWRDVHQRLEGTDQIGVNSTLLEWLEECVRVLDEEAQSLARARPWRRNPPGMPAPPPG